MKQNTNNLKDKKNQENMNKKKPGRPTIVEKRGDPDLPTKAMKLRLQGLSWSQIAKELDVSRTPARRLCEKRTQKENVPQSEKINENREEEPDYLKIDEIFHHMPKSYQRFVRPKINEKSNRMSPMPRLALGRIYLI